jgi:phosphate uptake regulator
MRQVMRKSYQASLPQIWLIPYSYGTHVEVPLWARALYTSSLSDAAGSAITNPSAGMVPSPLERN